MRRIVSILALILVVWLAEPALAHSEIADSRLSAHELLRFLHVVLFVFWIGPDVAVYIVSRTTISPAMNDAQRLAAARMMPVIELLPRVCISLMLTVAGLLSEYVGLEHPPWQMAGIVLLGPVWLTLTLVAALRPNAPIGRQAMTLEGWLRWALVTGIVISVGYSISTGRLAEAPYVGSKLLLFAGVVLLSLMLRNRMRPFQENLARLAAVGRTPDLDLQMTTSLNRTRPFVHAIWAALLLAALIGVIKPGAVEQDAATALDSVAVITP
jgi:hypothetical protein